jgi:Ser/Thr protein kinase RdoA (MazF antagonist)
MDDRTAHRTFAPAEQLSLARGLGRGLARLEALRADVEGEVDASCAFAAYPAGHRRHLASEIALMADAAQAHGAFTDGDREFVAEVVDAALASPPPAGRATYVHADYKLDNVVFERTDHGFEVCGVFDLHTSCFGEGTLDLCRTACSHLERDDALASAFVRAWREASGTRAADPAVVRLQLVDERMKIWEYFTRPAHRAPWTRATTFAAFVSRFAGRFERLFE